MKSLIIFSSRHHENTQKLVNAIARKYPVDLVDADVSCHIPLEEYDLIGFASGIDFGKFYPSVTDIASALPAGKRVYALFICAKDNGKYGSEIQEIAVQRDCCYLGQFGCRGFNTYGPWKLIGGMNRQNPSPDELDAGVAFYEKVLKTAPL